MESNKLTLAQMTETHRQKVGEALWSRERPRCQTALVDDLLKSEIDGFSVDDIENVYPDASDWGIEKCREYLREVGADMPSPDPWKMTRDELAEALTDVSIEPGDDDKETLRQAVIANIDDETIEGLGDWRDAVADNSEPAEPLEWWEVGDWLAERLAREGECVIRNGYGDWWGRCCSGQSTCLDDVIQRLGAEYCAYALTPNE